MVTDAEIQTRVDAWINSRELGGALAALADQWEDVSGRYGPQSAPARGVLLALVREAWAPEAVGVAGPDLRIIVEDNGNRASVSVYATWWRVRVADSLNEALVAVLEASPC